VLSMNIKGFLAEILSLIKLHFLDMSFRQVPTMFRKIENLLMVYFKRNIESSLLRKIKENEGGLEGYFWLNSEVGK